MVVHSVANVDATVQIMQRLGASFELVSGHELFPQDRC